MDFLNLIFGTAVSLLFLCLVFIPLEKAFPARQGQKTFRKGWLTDLCYF
ncbi:hypothetical protein [Niabella hibiscisoli]|nr:hypothetical protein [Niabella hibiscisoli]MCH5720945.1 hypothetical protein [Niabella hibiscisoli]